jgi:lipoprotein-anchoring transpeptidase ErfK/SrfK
MTAMIFRLGQYFSKSRSHQLLALLLIGTMSGCAVVPEVGMMADRDPAGHKIVIKLNEQRATLYKDGQVVGETRVSTGRPGYRTPVGHYAVLAKDIDHRSSFYGKYVMDGRTIKDGVDVRKVPKPRGATYVGAPMFYYLQIAPAYGLHSGYVPEYAASHGCIRLPARWARRFYYASKVGTPVIILP